MTPRIAGTQAKRACLVLLLCALAGEGASLRPRGPRRSPGWHPRCIKHSEPATSPDR